MPPCCSIFTFASSLSTQTTRWPISAKHADATRPTYLDPTTAIVAELLFAFTCLYPQFPDSCEPHNPYLLHYRITLACGTGSSSRYRHKSGRSRGAEKYRGINLRGAETQRNSQPRYKRSAQFGIFTWSPLRNAIAAPTQWIAGK